MKIQIGKTLSNSFTKRFKWITLNWRNSRDQKSLHFFNDGTKDQPLKISNTDGSSIIKAVPKHYEGIPPFTNSNLDNQPVSWPNIPDTNSWYGDPQQIIYDQESKLYYHWAIARYGKDFGSDWFEWTSPDLTNWKFNTIRLQRGRDNNGATGASFMGGSCVISDGKLAPKGHLMFFVSMQPWTDDRGHKGSDQNIGVFLSEGFGKPIYKRIIICDNLGGGDWRDSYAFYDNAKLYMGVAKGATGSGYQGSTMIYRIDSLDFNDVHFIEAVESPWGVKNGYEVPNIIRLSDDKWLICYSSQWREDDPQGKQPYYQTCQGGIYTRENEKFTLIRQIQLDYGPDGYARRLSNPYQLKEAPYVVSMTMMYNWGFTNGNQDSLKGVVSCSGVVKYYFDIDNFVRVKTFDKQGTYYKGTDFGNPVIFGGVSFLREGNRLRYGYNAPWKWISNDSAYISDESKINIWQNKNAVILTNETDGYQMIFKVQ